LKAIWAEDEAQFHGTQIDFDPIFAWPKPVQKPYPPIHLGGESPAAAQARHLRRRPATPLPAGWYGMFVATQAGDARTSVVLLEQMVGSVHHLATCVRDGMNP